MIYRITLTIRHNNWSPGYEYTVSRYTREYEEDDMTFVDEVIAKVLPLYSFFSCQQSLTFIDSTNKLVHIPSMKDVSFHISVGCKPTGKDYFTMLDEKHMRLVVHGMVSMPNVKYFG